LTATDGLLTAATSTGFAVAAVQSLRTSIVTDTLAPAVVAGAKVHDRVVVSETNLLAKTTGTVTTDVYAYNQSAGTVELGSYSRKFTWVTGKTYAVTVPISLISSTLDGTYEVYAIVQDAAGSSGIAVTAQRLTVAAPFISLTPSVTRVTLASAVVGGSKSKAVATVKITNGGNVASTGTTTVGIYASPDGNTDDAVLIEPLPKKISIKPGGSATIAVPLKLIPASLDGTYTILAEVTDPDGQTTSVNSGTTVQVAPAFVSIAASSAVFSPSTIAAGKTATLTVTLENRGNVPTTGQATIGIGLSTDGTTEAPNPASLFKTVALPVAKPVVLHLKFTIPSTTEAGAYFPFLTYTQDGDSTQTVGTARIAVG
jgi:hypothetical protein